MLLAKRPFIAMTVVAGCVLASSALAQVPTSLLNEGDPYPDGGPGHTVSALNNTAVNHAGGYAASLTSSDGTTSLSHVWGHAAGGPGANVRSEGTFGSLVQTSFESFYGFSDDGSVAYSASGTGGPVGGFDSVWKNDDPLAVEGDPYPHAPNTWWRFASRPGITAGGTPYWVGGLTDTQGGNTTNRGLFFGLTGAPVLVGGDAVPGLPDLLSTANSVSFDARYSADGAHYLAEVQMVGTSTTDGAMVMDGAGLLVDGSLVREGSPLPAAAGGLPGENWDNFDFTGLTNSGSWFFSGDSDGDSATDEMIVKNGAILYREGDIVDGETVSGSIEGAYMNGDGDVGFIWDIQGGTVEALYLNDQLILKEGDLVDFDGDGVVEPTSVLTDFTGISSLTVGDRGPTGSVTIYFTADIVTPAGTLEGFFCQRVDMDPTPVTLSGLSATPALRSASVTVQWSTSAEIAHDGFHVYRSTSQNGEYVALTDGLIRGRSPYRYVDGSVSRSTTYYYLVGAVDENGNEQRHGPVAVTTPGWGVRTELAYSRPNPFDRRTQIQFSLARESQASVRIFDVTGRQVATLVDEVLSAGDHAIWWDGSTDDGRRSSGGVYFYRLDTDEVSQTRKVVHLSGR